MINRQNKIRRTPSSTDVRRMELPMTTQSPPYSGNNRLPGNLSYYKDKTYCHQHPRDSILKKICICTLGVIILYGSYVLFRSNNVPSARSENNHRFEMADSSSSMTLEEEDALIHAGAIPPSFDRLDYHFGGAFHAGYFHPADAILGSDTFRFAAIADMDKLSRVENDYTKGKPKFRSILLPATLHRVHDQSSPTQQYQITWENRRELFTHHNEGGRGAEYSELTIFDNRLLTLDDRTGAVVELLSKESTTIPATRYVLTEGNGESSKGMKFEWAAVKGGHLYIGGIGKEMQLKDTHHVDHSKAMWIAIISPDGQIQRKDWSSEYNFVRQSVGCQLPGYLAHEAVLYSKIFHKWIFFPRRLSKHEFDAHLDERLGSNKVIIVDDDFTESTAIEVDLPRDGDAMLRGFSSVAFVPETGDSHVLALRSVEENCVNNDERCQFRTYISVFELWTGEIVMEETLIVDEPYKFEGVEFVDIYTPPPEETIR